MKSLAGPVGSSILSREKHPEQSGEAAMSGPRAVALQITAAQRAVLERIRQRQTACQRLVRRVLILLALAANPCIEAVAGQLRLSPIRPAGCTWRTCR